MSTEEQSTFSLKGQSLKCDTADSIDPHLQPLISFQDVQTVVLGGNTFGIGACEHLGSVLKDKKHLEEADLADIFTGRLISEIPQSLGSLCNSLLGLQNLTRLDLSDNAFGGRCVDVMVPFLSSHLPLEELRLANNGLGPAGATVIANALYQLGMKAKEAGQTSRLKKIICGRNRCENGSTKSWGKVFEIHPELIEVRLYQNDIRNHGWDPIMAGLAHCSKLQVLDMYDNTATEKGSRAVANALPHLIALRELNLGDCLLRPRGGTIIARALKLGSNPKLEHLKLSGSEIDEEVVGLLVDYVKQFGSQLKKVELNDNFGDAEAAGELSGIWGAMKDALDAWDNGAELDELDEIIERDSDDEDDNSEASELGEEEEEQQEEEKEGDLEDKKSICEEKLAVDPVEIDADEDRLNCANFDTGIDEGDNSEASEFGEEEEEQQQEEKEKDLEEKKSICEEKLAVDPVEIGADEEKPCESTIPDAEKVTPQVNENETKPPVVGADDREEKNPELVSKEQETKTGDNEVTNSTSSPQKGQLSKEDRLYDLLTQTIEALKLT